MDTQNFFPDFQPNQVLTNTQLNQLRQYLDDQTRLSRVRLVGTGIVCGLYANLESNHTLRITGGYGVSSDGFIIELNDTSYTKYRNYTDPNTVKQDEETEEPYPVYVPWRTIASPHKQIELLELLTDEIVTAPDFVEEEDNPAVDLTPGILQEKVLVLYLEMLDDPLKSCIVTDCNNKGENVVLNVRALLVDKDELDEVQLCEEKDKLIHVPRLITYLQSNDKTLADLTDIGALNNAYKKIFEHTSNQVKTEVKNLYDKYSYFLNLESEYEEDINQLENKLDNIFSSNNFNQYAYDFICDLAKAYNEFAKAICPLVKNCMFQGDFPRHLMMRDFIDENGNLGYSGNYRHFFVPSPARNVIHDNIQQIRKLFIRIIKLVDHFTGFNSEDLKVTPGTSLFSPLGKHSIPVYYDAEELLPWWQPDGCCELTPPISYQSNSMAENAGWPDAFILQENPLHLDPENQQYFHIAGHLGKNSESVKDEIRNIAFQFNLPFKVIALRLKGNSPVGYKDLCNYEDLQIQYLSEISELKCLLQKLAFYFAFNEENREWLIEQFGVKDLDPMDSLENHFEPSVIQLFFDDEMIDKTNKFTERIVSLFDLLVPDLADFNYVGQQQNFNNVYTETLEYAIWLKTHFNIKFFNIIRNQQHRFPAEFYAKVCLCITEVLRWLDDFIKSCSYQKLAILNAIFRYRIKYLNNKDPRIFSNFIKKYTGAEHNAGVNKGGTFIIVNNGVKKGDIGAGDVVADFALPYLCCTEDFCSDIPPPKPEDLDIPLIALPKYVRVDFGEYLFTQKHLANYRLSDEKDYTVINVLDYDIYADSFNKEGLELYIYFKGTRQSVEVCNQNIGGSYILPVSMPTSPEFLYQTPYGQLAIAFKEEGYLCFLYKANDNYFGLDNFDYNIQYEGKTSNLGKISIHIPCCDREQSGGCYNLEALKCWAMSSPNGFNQALQNRGYTPTGDLEIDATYFLEELRASCGFYEDELNDNYGLYELLVCLSVPNVPQNDYQTCVRLILKYQLENCCTGQNPCTVLNVSGYVKDVTGLALENVKIYSEDEKLLGTTNDNGYYNIDLESPGQTIIFYLDGYFSAEFEICNEPSLDVTLIGQVFLIPGDGLSGTITKKEIGGILKDREIVYDPDEPIERLIEKVADEKGKLGMTKNEANILTNKSIKRLLDNEGKSYTTNDTKKQLIKLLFAGR